MYGMLFLSFFNITLHYTTCCARFDVLMIHLCHDPWLGYPVYAVTPPWGGRLERVHRLYKQHIVLFISTEYMKESWNMFIRNIFNLYHGQDRL